MDLERVFDGMTVREHIKLYQELIAVDIDEAREERDTVCEDCLIGNLLESLPKSDWHGVMVGMSICLGLVPDRGNNIMHWLKHMVKIYDTEQEKVLDAETIEEK